MANYIASTNACLKIVVFKLAAADCNHLTQAVKTPYGPYSTATIPR
jgi:hypothetical protein